MTRRSLPALAFAAALTLGTIAPAFAQTADTSGLRQTCSPFAYCTMSVSFDALREEILRRIAAMFPAQPQPAPAKSCKVAGCSSQLCVDASAGDIVSTCEWREEYACYRSATCEVQQDGECGWTETPTLVSCLQRSAQ